MTPYWTLPEEVRTSDLRWCSGVLDFYESPTSRYVVAELNGPFWGDVAVAGPGFGAPQIHVFDHPTFAFDAAEDQLLCVDFESMRVVGCPDLETIEVGRLDVSRRPWSIQPLGRSGTWLLVPGIGDRASRVERGPLRVTATGEVALHQPVGSAFDAKTGLVVLTGDTNQMELFDPETMTSVATIALPVVESVYSVGAWDGRAWFASQDGRVLEYDLVTRGLVREYDLARRDHAALDLSTDGGWLVASSSDRDENHAWDTTCVVYRVMPVGLVEAARIDVHLESVPHDLCILPRTGRVLIGGGPSKTLVWQYR